MKTGALWQFENQREIAQPIKVCESPKSWIGPLWCDLSSVHFVILFILDYCYVLSVSHVWGIGERANQVRGRQLIKTVRCVHTGLEAMKTENNVSMMGTAGVRGIPMHCWETISEVVLGSSCASGCAKSWGQAMRLQGWSILSVLPPFLCQAKQLTVLIK